MSCDSRPFGFGNTVPDAGRKFDEISLLSCRNVAESVSDVSALGRHRKDGASATRRSPFGPVTALPSRATPTKRYA